MGNVVLGGITTHVLDTNRGRPAAGVGVRLDHWEDPVWQTLGHSQTDVEGRCRDLLPPRIHLPAGRYRLVFDTGAYYAGFSMTAFFPEVTIDLSIRDTNQDYHVPLLLSQYGYTTYRGS